ncbi:MAG TPA: hypothetical protein VF006_12890 [Longimicrobium sp.]
MSHHTDKQVSAAPGACPEHEAELEALFATDRPSMQRLACVLRAAETCAVCQLTRLFKNGEPAALGALRHLSSGQGVNAVPVTFEPIFVPAAPGCKLPVEMLEGQTIENVTFGEIRKVPEFKRLPSPKIEDGRVPLVVTTPFRVLLSYETTGEWSIALPLAPQKTRIVTRRGSRLFGWDDHELAARLGGCAIAIADGQSAFAARLASAARRYGFDVKICRRAPDKRRDDALYLITTGFQRMLDVFKKGDVDGFATVEPYPTLARHVLGQEYAEVRLDAACTSVSTDFCCVAAVPTPVVEEPRYRAAYEALVRGVLDSMCQLVTPGAIDLIAPLITSTVQPLAERVLPRTLDLNVRNEEFKQIFRGVAARIMSQLADRLPRTLGDDEWVRDQLLNVLAPVVPKTALNAEFEALANSLSTGMKRRLRAGTSKHTPLDELYPSSVVRPIAREVIGKAFSEGAGEEVEATRRAAQKEIKREIRLVEKAKQQPSGRRSA